MTMGSGTTSGPDFEMREPCATCGKHRPVCCGDFTNGFWCHDCCPHPYDEREDGYPYDDEDIEEGDFDCHMGPDGSCGLAGTEECDWDCPYRNVKRN